jgi:3-dehydroquinate synthase
MLTDVIPLALGYDVVLAPSFEGVRAAMSRLGQQRAVIVTNARVRSLHGAALEGELGNAATHWVELPDGEAFKNLDTWRHAVAGILVAQPDRQTAVLAFGGGVVGDIAGFAAASCLRGLPLLQLPTTLLAMVDSSVGGKTGVNVPEGKNLVGAFHQPRLVWAALHTLGTLPAREVRCGLGEVLKHGVLDSEVAMLALEAAQDQLAGGEAAALATAIARSVRVKAAIVEKDPTEAGERATLNLGHTLGHAIERCAGYGTWTHGDAVAVGVVAACRYAEHRGHARPGSLAGRVAALAQRLGLPTYLADELDEDALTAAMGFDKKRERGMVKLVIPSSPGSVSLLRVPHEELRVLCRLSRVKP